MKARVKATGEIIEFTELMLLEEDRTTYRKTEDLEFLDLPINEPDYWEKLKHQAAITAMQGIINNDGLLTALCQGNKETTISNIVTSNAVIMATKLVNKLKEEEK